MSGQDVVNLTQKTKKLCIHPKAEYKLFSSTHEIFSRIDYIIGHTISPSKLKKTLISYQVTFLTTIM